MSDIALQTHGLGVRYGTFDALSDVDLSVKRNSVHSIIGPNGAGKTTMFHALTGTVAASSGRIELEGRDVTRASDDDRVRLGIARSFQVTSLFPELSLHENLRLAAQGRTPWQALIPWRSAEASKSVLETADAVIERLSLSHVATRAAGELSHGQQRRLEVGMAIAFPLAFAVLMAATMNWAIALLAIYSVMAICASVLGFCELIGWNLGTGEAIAGVMVIGLSVDYTIHLGHMYADAEHMVGAKTRKERFEFAAEKMVSTVCAGALTTGVVHREPLLRALAAGE